jgi:hypothetical protein
MKKIIITFLISQITISLSAQSLNTKLNYFEAEGQHYYILNEIKEKTDFQIYNQPGGGKVIANFTATDNDKTIFNFDKAQPVGFALFSSSKMVYHLEPKMFEFDDLQITNDGANMNWMACQNKNQNFSFLIQGTNDGKSFIDIETIANKTAETKQKIEVIITKKIFESYRILVINNNCAGNTVYTSKQITNPFIGIIYPTNFTNSIKVLCFKKNATLEIYNLSGQLLLSQYLDNGINLIQTLQLNTGLYLAKIKSNNESKTFSIIKK